MTVVVCNVVTKFDNLPRFVDFRRTEAPLPELWTMFTTGAVVYCEPAFSMMIEDTPSLTRSALNLALMPLPPVTFTSGADR